MDASLDKLAKMGDNLYDESSTVPTVFNSWAVSKAQNENEFFLKKLYRMMKNITDRMTELENNRSRNKTSDLRYRNRSRKHEELIDCLCCYHRRFAKWT